MYNYFFPKAILQRFSSFHTTFWKQTLQTTDIGNFVICLISHILIGLTVCYFVIPKISSRPDHWCQKVFLAKKVIYDILEAQRRYGLLKILNANIFAVTRFKPFSVTKKESMLDTLTGNVRI